MSSVEPEKVTSSDSGSGAGSDPKRPDLWSQNERRAAEDEEAELFAKYHALQSSYDAIYNFKMGCERRNVHYADAFLSGDLTPDEYKKVDDARKALAEFWRRVGRLYRSCRLACDGVDFFSPTKRWFRMGNDFRALVEPLDIANWYKAGNLQKGSGHYFDVIADGESGLRPTHYAMLDRLMKDAFTAGQIQDYVNSVSKAKEYKSQAVQGYLKVHKLADARADPPRGFLRMASLDIPDQGDIDKDNKDGGLKLTPQSRLDNPASGPPTPVTSTTAGQSSSTDPKREAYLPPGWGPGVKYLVKDWKPLRVAPHSLPAPVVEKSPLHSSTGWSPPEGKDKSAPIQVKFSTLAYEAANHNKYLVVRAKVSSIGAMVDTLESSGGKRCGYCQESVAISIHPKIADQPDGVVREEAGTFAKSDSGGEPLTVKVAVEKASTRNVGLTVGHPGPIVAASVNAGYTSGGKHIEEVSGISREGLEMVYTPNDARLMWTARLGAFKDGAGYGRGNAKGEDKQLRDVPNFAKGELVVDVQGTWQLPAGYVEPLVLEVEIQQVLCYSALVNNVAGMWKTVKTYEDILAKGVFHSSVVTSPLVDTVGVSSGSSLSVAFSSMKI